MVEKTRIQEMRKAILDDDIEKVTDLFNSNADLRHFMTVFGTWLHVAARHGKLEIVRFLVNSGIGVDIRGGITGGAALDLAASQGHVDVVRYLLSEGATIDVSQPERNPLFGAIYGGHTAVAKLLIDKGIDTHVKYTGGSMKEMDALAFAKEWGRNDIVDLLS